MSYQPNGEARIERIGSISDNPLNVTQPSMSRTSEHTWTSPRHFFETG